MKETDIILMAMAVCAVCAIAGGFIFDRMKAKKSSPINTGSFIVGISYGTMISILGALWLLIIPYLYVIINVDDVVILFAGIFYVMTVSMMFFLIMMTVLNVMGEKVICRYKLRLYNFTFGEITEIREIYGKDGNKPSQYHIYVKNQKVFVIKASYRNVDAFFEKVKQYPQIIVKQGEKNR